MNLKPAISNILRDLKLIHFTDTVRFFLNKNSSANRKFKVENPNVVLPPDYLMYESFQLDYSKYYDGGKKTAQWLIGLIEKHKPLQNLTVLDWGCGPGRVIRHFPALLDKSNKFYGTDYNPASVKWCSENLKGITFSKNELKPPLPFENSFFDVIYGISIFTHLSEELHYDWIRELYRVLKPGAVLILTMQGDNFKIKLASDELKIFKQGNLVVRGNVREGHRVYSAFHPQPFLKKLFHNFEILEHIREEPTSKDYVPQDIWILKK